MAAQPSRTGLMISALGGVALAIGVFLPWYGISFTQAALATTTQALNSFSAQYGVGARLGATFSNLAQGLVGHELASVSARQALTNISLVLILVGVLAALIAILGLYQSRPALPQNAIGGLVLGGAVATLLVLYRVLSPPDSHGLINLSIKPAAWLCLLGAAAITAGGLWPRPADSAPAGDASVWSELSGWTPSA
jgi:hypothetical protein